MHAVCARRVLFSTVGSLPQALTGWSCHHPSSSTAGVAKPQWGLKNSQTPQEVLRLHGTFKMVQCPRTTKTGRCSNLEPLEDVLCFISYQLCCSTYLPFTPHYHPRHEYYCRRRQDNPIAQQRHLCSSGHNHNQCKRVQLKTNSWLSRLSSPCHV